MKIQQARVPKILLTVPEVVQATGISRSKLYDLIARGKLAKVKIGKGASGGVLIRPQDLEEFARKHLIKGS